MNTNDTLNSVRHTDAPQAVEETQLPVAQPPVDILESEDAFILVADMPGLNPGAIDVHLERDTLHVEGRTASDGLDPVLFKRSFRVLRGLNPDAISASYNLGVLTVRLPKPESIRPRKINVVAG